MYHASLPWWYTQGVYHASLASGCTQGVTVVYSPGGVYTRVYMVGIVGYTRVYMVGMVGYTRVGRVGIPCIYAQVGREAGIPPCIYPTICSWVHSVCTPSVLYSRVHCHPLSRCRTMEPWAQKGRNPWVEASQDPKVINPVREERRLCAELLRSTSEERVEDWIDEGSFTVYYRRLGTCCA